MSGANKSTMTLHVPKVNLICLSLTNNFTSFARILSLKQKNVRKKLWHNLEWKLNLQHSTLKITTTTQRKDLLVFVVTGVLSIIIQLIYVISHWKRRQVQHNYNWKSIQIRKYIFMLFFVFADLILFENTVLTILLQNWIW